MATTSLLAFQGFSTLPSWRHDHVSQASGPLHNCRTQAAPAWRHFTTKIHPRPWHLTEQAQLLTGEVGLLALISTPVLQAGSLIIKTMKSAQ